MKKLLLVIIAPLLLVSCAQYEAEKLELTDDEIEGYWVASDVATKTGFADAPTKCSIITTKPNSGAKIYPKAYLVRNREIAVVYTEPTKIDAPLDAFAIINIDGTFANMHNAAEGLVSLSPTPDPDQLLLTVQGQTEKILLQRVAAGKITAIQKIVKECN